jgi:hypothetical protein
MVPILRFMGGSAAEVPDSPDEQPAIGLRASDADRDQVVARLRDEFVAGRLSHDTFLHRMDVVLQTRRQADLPAMVADLPAPPLPAPPLPAPPLPAQPVPAPPAGRSLAGWLSGTWHRMAGSTRQAGWPRGGSGPAGAAPSGPPALYGPPALPGSPLSGPAASAVPRLSAARRVATTSMSASPERGRPLALPFPRGDGSHFSIGRDAGCDLAIPDMTVSRRHAELERTADGWLLSDLRSTNGTRVNGWRVRGKVPVRAGDLVNFGDLQVFFLPGDAPPARP